MLNLLPAPNFHRSFWRVVFALFAVMVAMAWEGTVWGQEQTDDQRIVSGLRERRLFELAELHIAKRMSAEELSDFERANLVIETIQTRTAEAIQATGADKEAKWQAAFSVGPQFVQQNPNNPRTLLVEVQTALARLSRGRFLSQQLAAGVSGGDLRNQALKNINDARRELEGLDRKTGLAIPRAGEGSAQDQAVLSASQLRVLQKQLRFQRATCGLQTAKLYPPEDQLNRMDSLANVIARLEEVSQQTNPEMPLWWNVQIERIRALNLLEKFDEARAELNKISTKEVLVSDQRKSDFLVQQIELALAQGVGNTEQLIGAAAGVTAHTAELDLALVRLMMKVGTSATAKTEQDRWQQAASELTKAVEQTHGRYYGRLAELAVIGEVGGSSNGSPTNSTNLDILVRTGDESWRKGQLDDAIKAFDKASLLAIDNQNFDAAMSAGMKSAKILEQQKKLEPAGRRLVELSVSLKENRAAPSAHLVGCWHLANAARANRELVTEYAEQLQRHVELWPTAVSANQARLWLARYQSSQQDWRAAYESLIAIDESSSHLADAALLLPQVIRSDIDSKTEGDQFPITLASEYSQELLAKLKRAGVGPNDTWTRGTRAWLVSTADVNLSYARKQREFSLAELTTLLNRAISESSDADTAWVQNAHALRVALMATRKETILEAIESTVNLAAADSTVLARCWDSVNGDIRSTASDDQISQLKLTLVELAVGREQAEADKNVWLRRKSKLLVESGRGAEAITMLQGLVEANPRRLDLRIQLATAYSGTEGQSEAALRNWRIVAQGVKPRTENYFEAKYNIAKLMAASGDREEAKQLLEYLKIPPGWSDSKRKNDLENLLNELSR